MAHNIAAVLLGVLKNHFHSRPSGCWLLSVVAWGVARVLGFNFSGFFAWWLWRTVYLSKLPGLDKKVRVAFDWTLDLLFPKDVCAVYDLDNSRDFEKDNIQLGPLEPSEGCALVERVYPAHMHL